METSTNGNPAKCAPGAIGEASRGSLEASTHRAVG